MQRGTAVRNRSERLSVATPRGRVEVARQEMRGLRRGSGWEWFWVARREGKVEWSEATAAKEAIRRATLLPTGKPPAWLMQAALDAEQQIVSGPSPDRTDTAASPSTG